MAYQKLLWVFLSLFVEFFMFKAITLINRNCLNKQKLRRSKINSMQTIHGPNDKSRNSVFSMIKEICIHFMTW